MAKYHEKLHARQMANNKTKVGKRPWQKKFYEVFLENLHTTQENASHLCAFLESETFIFSLSEKKVNAKHAERTYVTYFC